MLLYLTFLIKHYIIKKNLCNFQDFKENLKVGGQSYLSGNYRKAADNYKAAYERVGKRYLVSIVVFYLKNFYLLPQHI
jgi:hypothetical protein